MPIFYYHMYIICIIYICFAMSDSWTLGTTHIVSILVAYTYIFQALTKSRYLYITSTCNVQLIIYSKHLKCPSTYVFPVLTMSKYLYIPSTYHVQVLIYSKHLKCPSTYIFTILTFLKTYIFQGLTLSHYNTKPACQYFVKFNSQFAIVWLVV